MSRIIKNLIESSFVKNKISNLIVFLHPDKIDQQILSLNCNLISFQEHKLDTDKRLIVVNPDVVNTSLAFLPDVVLCTHLGHYGNAHQLSNALRLPFINIIRENIGVKREQMFELAKGPLSQNINLLPSDKLAIELFILNYHLIEEDLEKQILYNINNWIPN